MTEFYVSRHIKGRAKADGLPFEYFRGIHVVRDALADSHEANALGIKPVDEMSDDEWRNLGLDRDLWMAANRPKPEPEEAKAEPEFEDAKPERVAEPVPAGAPKSP